MKKKLGIALIVIAAIFVSLYFVFPGPVYKAAVYAARSGAGLSRTAVQVDDHRIVYLEGGKGAAVLLVHGYGADKDNWTRFAGFLTPRYRVIVPDIAGFGESSRLPDASYDIESQVKRLDRFAAAAGLDKFHIAGNSMGGQIAGTYAAQYPGKVLSLGLFAPSGIRSPEKSDALKLFEKGINPLLIKTPGDFDRMLEMVFTKVPYIPYPIKKAAANNAIRNGPFNEKIREDIMRSPLSLEPFLAGIEAPTLILWGDSDRILHVSGVRVLEKGIRDHRTFIMKDCGHIPMMERPREAADIYLNFLKDTKK